MKPMLAATVVDTNSLTYPLLASPKLDGIRALVHKGKLVSRNLKPIPNKHTQKLYSVLPEGFDGELIVGQPNSATCFRDTSSGCMSVDGIPSVHFYVFDFIDETQMYGERRKYLQEFFKRYKDRNVKLVPQVRIKDSFALHEYEGQLLSRGYEGVMLRTFDGAYKFGRSTLREGYLMKLKRFMDSEAEILGVVELMHNHNEQTRDNLGRSKRSSHKAGKVAAGVVGALRVRDVNTGVEFEIGAGLTDEDRAMFWKTPPIGVCVKYKYFPQGSKDKPRFPVFLGFRDYRDI